MFGDVKFVCVGGSAIWMKAFAQFMHTELGLNESDSDLLDICAGTDRYNMYKTGPVFVHKWLDPGTVVIIGTAVDSSFQPKFEQVVLGKIITRSTELDKDRAQELLNCGSEVDDYPVIIGNTMCTYDFYEGNFKKNTQDKLINPI
ncbi:hypothetical protein chiPu_0000429 [Chiloscyllium punctatum]|uniref:Uncharacterized protein n=1 Tax=Chiloscyllium punctatum TaxID=137246 RepID=A0A401RV73_CHIPU|nr:hypothetical protein [Chiloscyllium punctatum]